MRFVDSADGEESSGALVDRSFNGAASYASKGVQNFAKVAGTVMFSGLILAVRRQRDRPRQGLADRKLHYSKAVSEHTPAGEKASTGTVASEETRAPTESRALPNSTSFRTGAAIAIAVVIGLILWLALRNTGGGGGAKAVSPAELQSLAASVGHPVFWLGPQDGDTNELTRKSDGSIIIRYLPPGVGVGAQGQYWSVGTYRFRGGFAAIQRVLRAGGATRINLAHGGLAEYANGNPNNVHVGYPGYDYQVEVFAPAGQAAALVRAGRLTSFGGPKGGVITPKPKAASPAALRSLARSLGHPVYWAGPKKGYTYELNRDPSNGNISIRYLPPGVHVGAKHAYVSVGTYPFADAIGGIQRAAKQKGQRTIKLKAGGLAVYNPKIPTDVHLAYPRSNYQAEVFDPAGKARQLVASGRITVIG
jgi:hypothetical protein